VATYLNGYGVWGQADNDESIGVYGGSDNGYAGWFNGEIAGIFFGSASCCDQAGVHVYNNGSGVGLWASTSGSNAGIFGQGGSGVVGEAVYNGGIGVQGRLGPGVTSGLAGQFLGNVDITGNILAPAFVQRIDHPLNPTGEYLNQAYIAAPEQLSVYSGNVTTDADGIAVVTLPSYVEALNTDFRYQLTPIGQFAQAIIAAEIQDGSFTIRTDQPFVKVSWQVTGVRQDAYAKYSPLVVEQAKPPAIQGLYQNPQAYGQPYTSGVATIYNNAAQAVDSGSAQPGVPR
jgi:hypothetical protein